MSKTVYKTVFTIEVLSREVFAPNGGDNDPFDLAEINYAITEGDCIGVVEREWSKVVPAEQVTAELIRIGNDGSFFDDPWDDEEAK